MSGPAQLKTTFVVKGPALDAQPIEVTESIWSELDERFGDFVGHTLISSFEFSEAWPTWEMHPAGDEIVCLIDGDVDMTLATADGDQTVRLSTPGEFVIVPRGIWHTASPHRKTTMLFVTPGEGTENREQPERPQ